MSKPIDAFHQKFAESSEFRKQIRKVESLPQFLAILEEWGCELSGPEIVNLAQTAFQKWISKLESDVQSFFQEAHTNHTLNRAIESCRNIQDAVELANRHGFHLSEIDLIHAAAEAHKIDGFSFEKLWFRSLGL